MTKEEVIAIFANFDLTPGERQYLIGQSGRLAYLTSFVQGHLDKFDAAAALLDVGPHLLTRTLIERLTPKPRFWTLGYPFNSVVPSEMIEKNHTCDLNEISSLGNPFDGRRFDIILICEVIEHLFIPPSVVFSALRPLLREPGGLLIAGTPNAVSIAKRIKMLLGENPFHELSENYRNGAVHIREYTMRELRRYGEQSGLKVLREEFCDYWGEQRFPGMEIMSENERNFPEYREGLTIVYTIE